MTINIELDNLTKDFYLVAKSDALSLGKLEYELSNFIEKELNKSYKIYLFLSDGVWSENSNIVRYKGLWKQSSVKDIFDKYSSNQDHGFLSMSGKKIIYASMFEISKNDLINGIRVNSSIQIGHSFLFLSKDTVSFSIEELFNALDITDDSYIGNNWNSLAEFMHRSACIPLQKWIGSEEVSLRFFSNSCVKEIFPYINECV